MTTRERRVIVRKRIAVLLACLLLVGSVSPALAGGDKVRGENGQGAVNQVQEQDPAPFQ